MKAAIVLISLSVFTQKGAATTTLENSTPEYSTPDYSVKDNSTPDSSVDNSACKFPIWKGDYLCDDGNNNEECDWDGGDCCPLHPHVLWNIFCDDCECLDPNADLTQTDCFEPFWANDNYCDDYNNTPECNFDGGACCNNENRLWNIYCKDCQCLEEKNEENEE